MGPSQISESFYHTKGTPGDGRRLRFLSTSIEPQTVNVRGCIGLWLEVRLCCNYRPTVSEEEMTEIAPEGQLDFLASLLTRTRGPLLPEPFNMQ